MYSSVISSFNRILEIIGDLELKLLDSVFKLEKFKYSIDVIKTAAINNWNVYLDWYSNFLVL